MPALLEVPLSSLAAGILTTISQESSQDCVLKGYFLDMVLVWGNVPADGCILVTEESWVDAMCLLNISGKQD